MLVGGRAEIIKFCIQVKFSNVNKTLKKNKCWFKFWGVNQFEFPLKATFSPFKKFEINVIFENKYFVWVGG